MPKQLPSLNGAITVTTKQSWTMPTVKHLSYEQVKTKQEKIIEDIVNLKASQSPERPSFQSIPTIKHKVEKKKETEVTFPGANKKITHFHLDDIQPAESSRIHTVPNYKVKRMSTSSSVSSRRQSIAKLVEEAQNTKKPIVLDDSYHSFPTIEGIMAINSKTTDHGFSINQQVPCRREKSSILKEIDYRKRVKKSPRKKKSSKNLEEENVDKGASDFLVINNQETKEKLTEEFEYGEEAKSISEEITEEVKLFSFEQNQMSPEADEQRLEKVKETLIEIIGKEAFDEVINKDRCAMLKQSVKSDNRTMHYQFLQEFTLVEGIHVKSFSTNNKQGLDRIKSLPKEEIRIAFETAFTCYEYLLTKKEPFLPSTFSNRMFDIVELMDLHSCFRQLFMAIKGLPRRYFCTLKAVIGHLYRIIQLCPLNTLYGFCDAFGAILFQREPNKTSAMGFWIYSPHNRESSMMSPAAVESWVLPREVLFSRMNSSVCLTLPSMLLYHLLTHYSGFFGRDVDEEISEYLMSLKL